MTFEDYKAALKNKLVVDGHATVALDVTFDTDFCKRARRLIDYFSRFVLCFYKSRVALTLAENDLEIELADAKLGGTGIDYMHHPFKLWIANSLVPKAEDFATFELRLPPNPGTGSPQCWLMSKEGFIHFDRPCASGLANCYVSGWRPHIEIDADGDVLEIPRMQEEDLLEYSASNFIRESADDDVGLGRLKLYSRASYNNMVRNRARAIRLVGA